MPLNLPGLTGAIAGGLASGGMHGISVPQIAAGIAAGILIWTPQVTVLTVDAGVLGSGTGILPLLIPNPLLVGAMVGSFPSGGLLGIMSPGAAAGLGNGLALGFAQGIIQTVHPTVGVGTGIVKFIAPPAFPSIVAGLAGAGVHGISAAQFATAVSIGLALVFNSFSIPIPIVGSPSPTGSSGVGAGKII